MGNPIAHALFGSLVVLTSGYGFLFKYTLGHCVSVCNFMTAVIKKVFEKFSNVLINQVAGLILFLLKHLG